jgi:hypothetical protein
MSPGYNELSYVGTTSKVCTTVVVISMNVVR